MSTNSIRSAVYLAFDDVPHDYGFTERIALIEAITQRIETSQEDTAALHHQVEILSTALGEAFKHICKMRDQRLTEYTRADKQ